MNRTRRQRPQPAANRIAPRSRAEAIAPSLVAVALALGAQGCGAPASSDLAASSAPFSFPDLTPPVPPLVLAPPPIVVNPPPPPPPPLPKECNSAVGQGGPSENCDASGTGWQGHLLISTNKATYCHFSPIGNGQPDINALRIRDRIVEPDCSVVGLSGPAPAPTLDSKLWRGLMNTFRRQVSAVRWQPDPAGSQVTVAVVDSAAWDYGVTTKQDTFGHGRLVGRTIADLACPDDVFLQQPGACRLVLRNALAVPRLPDLVSPAGIIDSVNGGYFGTRGELGEALASALASWEGTRGVGDRLILNLSLGWEAALPAAFASDVATNAIITLLERASCLGALSIAAAGNQAEAGNGGPFLPAFWETRAAPNHEQCSSRWPGIDVDASASRKRPLVYAAAAVNEQDHPLLTTRLGGSPRLVATGLGAITRDKRAPEHTLVLSGSSMAAAVVSGIAAATWQIDGSSTGPEIMDIIYKAGIDLSSLTPVVPTVLCLSPPCDPQVRVSLCRALNLAGSSIGLPPLACPTVGAGMGGDPKVGSSPPGGPTPTCTGCVPGPQPPADKPWVWPQPSGAACPSCIFYSTGCTSSPGVWGHIDVGLVNKFNGLGSVTSVAARVTRDGVGPSDFGLGSTLVPDPFWLGQPGPAYSAAISFTIRLSGIPGVASVTTFPQDIPVVCP